MRQPRVSASHHLSPLCLLVTYFALHWCRLVTSFFCISQDTIEAQLESGRIEYDEEDVVEPEEPDEDESGEDPVPAASLRAPGRSHQAHLRGGKTKRGWLFFGSHVTDREDE